MCGAHRAGGGSPVELLAQFGRVRSAVPVAATPSPLREKGAAMRIVEVTGGVDTHADFHVAAAVDANGGLVGVESFPAEQAGFENLLGWLAGFGVVVRVGVEGTGSYGVGLARFLTDAGIEVVEVDRQNRQIRRKKGKSDPTDAVTAARAALSGAASVIPKLRNGPVEQMRVLLVVRRSARLQRSQSLNRRFARYQASCREVSFPRRTRWGRASSHGCRTDIWPCCWRNRHRRGQLSTPVNRRGPHHVHRRCPGYRSGIGTKTPGEGRLGITGIMPCLTWHLVAARSGGLEPPTS